MPTELPIDATAFTDQDAKRTLGNLGIWWTLLLDGLDPGPAAPFASQQVALLGGTEEPGMLGEQVERLLAGRATRDRHELDALVVGSLELIRAAGQALAASGAFAVGEGTVAGLFTSDGGVPKRPVDRVAVGPHGLAGDRQATRAHHGRPWQAVCLWSAEAVAELRAEGHPIYAGAAGENVSVAGVDWSVVRPGCRLRLGTDVVVEVGLPALPCATNARWFSDRDFSRIHHKRQPGISRQYATVLAAGTVASGDPVALNP